MFLLWFVVMVFSHKYGILIPEKNSNIVAQNNFEFHLFSLFRESNISHFVDDGFEMCVYFICLLVYF